MKIDGTKEEFIVDTESPVKLQPPYKENIEGKKQLLVTRKDQDVIETEVKITGKITVEAESKAVRKNLSILITEWEDIKPLLGMD